MFMQYKSVQQLQTTVGGMYWSCRVAGDVTSRHTQPFTRVLQIQAEHLTSCYWGGSSNPTERHDPSLPYLEQYRIDMEQFKGLFKQLFPWANGAQSDLLAVRFFRLLDQNCDGLINFREFINGLGRRNDVFFIL